MNAFAKSGNVTTIGGALKLLRFSRVLLHTVLVVYFLLGCVRATT